MNAILKFVIYAILLFIHMFGATACYFLGLIGIAIAIGFYLAPVVVTFVITFVIGIFKLIGFFFEKLTGGRKE